MYLRCSNSMQAAGFIRAVLDPQPYFSQSYTTKPDFLKGRNIFLLVKFPNWPLLDNLLKQLAELFSVRYTVDPGEDAKSTANSALVNHDESDLLIRQAHALWYIQFSAYMNSHECVLQYFNNALKDRSEWPSNDRAEKQIFGDGVLLSDVLMEPIMKTGWTSLA